jgi:protoheme IX farnesyltransferase
VRAILWYTAAMVAVTLLPVLLDTVGVLYLAAALALGAIFLALAVGLARETTPRRAGVLFHYSLAYLALLFVAMALDPILL